MPHPASREKSRSTERFTFNELFLTQQQDTNKRLDQMDKRLDRVESRMDKLETKIDKLADKIDDMHKELKILIKSRANSDNLNWRHCYCGDLLFAEVSASRFGGSFCLYRRARKSFGGANVWK